MFSLEVNLLSKRTTHCIADNRLELTKRSTTPCTHEFRTQHVVIAIDIGIEEAPDWTPNQSILQCKNVFLGLTGMTYCLGSVIAKETGEPEAIAKANTRCLHCLDA